MTNMTLMKHKQLALRDLWVGDGWGPPKLLGISSSGWEDSASLNPDGESIYFSYVQMDYMSWLLAGGDFNVISNYRQGPDRGNLLFFAFDSFKAGLHGHLVERLNLSATWDPEYVSQTGLVERDGILYFAANHPASPGAVPRLWMNDGETSTLLTIPDGPSEHHDPTVLGSRLLFWAPSATGNQIWETVLDEGVWSEPVLATGHTMNEEGFDFWQPFLAPADDTLLFSSSLSGIMEIWRAGADGGGWGAPQKLVTFFGDTIHAVGEPSMSDDGKVLAFVVLSKLPWNDSFDLDIAICRR